MQKETSEAIPLEETSLQALINPVGLPLITLDTLLKLYQDIYSKKLNCPDYIYDIIKTCANFGDGELRFSNLERKLCSKARQYLYSISKENDIEHTLKSLIYKLTTFEFLTQLKSEHQAAKILLIGRHMNVGDIPSFVSRIHGGFIIINGQLVYINLGATTKTDITFLSRNYGSDPVAEQKDESAYTEVQRIISLTHSKLNQKIPYSPWASYACSVSYKDKHVQCNNEALSFYVLPDCTAVLMEILNSKVSSYREIISTQRFTDDFLLEIIEKYPEYLPEICISLMSSNRSSTAFSLIEHVINRLPNYHQSALDALDKLLDKNFIPLSMNMDWFKKFDFFLTDKLVLKIIARDLGSIEYFKDRILSDNNIVILLAKTYRAVHQFDWFREKVHELAAASTLPHHEIINILKVRMSYADNFKELIISDPKLTVLLAQKFMKVYEFNWFRENIKKLAAESTLSNNEIAEIIKVNADYTEDFKELIISMPELALLLAQKFGALYEVNWFRENIQELAATSILSHNDIVNIIKININYTEDFKELIISMPELAVLLAQKFGALYEISWFRENVQELAATLSDNKIVNIIRSNISYIEILKERIISEPEIIVNIMKLNNSQILKITWLINAFKGIAANLAEKVVLDIIDRNQLVMDILEELIVSKWSLARLLICKGGSKIKEKPWVKKILGNEHFVSESVKENKFKVFELAVKVYSDDVDTLSKIILNSLEKDARCIASAPQTLLEDYNFVQEALKSNVDIIGYLINKSNPDFLRVNSSLVVFACNLLLKDETNELLSQKTLDIFCFIFSSIYCSKEADFLEWMIPNKFPKMEQIIKKILNKQGRHCITSDKLREELLLTLVTTSPKSLKLLFSSISCDANFLRKAAAINPEILAEVSPGFRELICTTKSSQSTVRKPRF